MKPEEQIAQQKVRVLIFFALFVFFTAIFLAKMGYEALGERELPPQKTTLHNKSMRGKIISKDGFTLSESTKLYKAMIYAKGIEEGKRDLFINLFSIYSGMDPKRVRKRLGNFDRTVVLSYKIDATKAKYLKELSRKLYKLGVYKRLHKSDGTTVTYKLEILESGESREFFYLDTLTPLLGHMTKIDDDGYTKPAGLKGVERSYERELSSGVDGKWEGKRDVLGDIILDSNSIRKARHDGFDVYLNINLKFQKRVEQILDEYQEKLQAQEIIAVVMDSISGKVLSFASSNRYIPDNIKQNQIGYLNPTATEYLYEPGSVIKPITFTILLEQDKVNPLEIIKVENGRYRLNGHLITDEHKKMWLSAENILVYSSNIGIAKLAQRLEGYEMYEGFKRFGLTEKSGIDLPYENVGRMKSLSKLNRAIYKANTGYGYGLSVNLMQLLRAHTVFNNGGYLLQPQVVNYIQKEDKRYIQKPRRQQILSSTVAAQMNGILQKVVKEGSGQRAQIEGLSIGGKTGTAHISVKGRYRNLYNSTFIGFVNDEKNRYNIAVLTVKPKKKYYHFASLTSVPVFKEIALKMIELDFLKPRKKKE